MKMLSKSIATRKPAGRSRTKLKISQDDVPLAVRIPVYAASLGLFAVYAAGYLHADLGWLAWGLVGVTACSELLKPKLGELAADAIENGDATAQRIIAAAAAVSVVIGAAGGVVALHVADAPRRAYQAAAADVRSAETATAEARRLVDSVPTCTPEMPARRCDRMTAENAPVLAERRARLEVAQRLERAERAELKQAPVPGPGLPHVELWHKALFIGGAEFLMFGVPFVAMRRSRRGRGVIAPPAEVVETPAPDLSKTNTGGWERRRELYGPTGRRSKQNGTARDRHNHFEAVN